MADNNLQPGSINIEISEEISEGIYANLAIISHSNAEFVVDFIRMMPGVPKELKGAEIGDDQLKPVEAIIRSMTLLERRKPEVINGSRRTRIANGSGTSVGDVNRLVKQFGEMQKMMKKMGGMAMGGKGKKAKKGRGLPNLGGMPGGFPNFN